ncbi:MAG: DUF6316 family protein [Ectothiorhodospiraceae bacterium]|jgi:hypothetical protein
MRQRKGESGHVPFRNGRFHCIDNKWFFSTRGSALHGPYRDQDEAERALERELTRRR